MGEIDTKSIESVQAALSLFGEKADLRKHRSSSSGSSGDAESEKEELEKEVATYKVQLEAKESAYMQLLLKLQQYEEKVDDLSALLMKLQRERDQCMDECRESQTHVDELQIKVKEMSDELSETIKAHDQQLTVAVSELKSTQARLLSLETELAAEREMKIKAISEAETMENAAAVEKEELKEEIVRLEMAAVEAEEEKNAALQHKNKQIQELEDQLEEKFDVIRSLQIDREQANKQAKEDETDEFSFTLEEPCLEKILSFDHKKYKITIPLEEYESLVNKEEVEVLKKELESAMAKAGEFRTRAEQAMSRAHSAEKAKEMVEVQLRSWKEQKQRRKAAMAALREESASRGFNPPTMHDSRALTHPPLGKVLNMKF